MEIELQVRELRLEHLEMTKAAFVGWIVRTKDSIFVRRLNDACRRGLYRPELFQEYAWRPLEDLWAEFISGFTERRRPL